jgi:hypothetical protein
MEFEKIIIHLPKLLKIRLEALKYLVERKDYHPEESCYEHIKIVYNRLKKTRDKDLMLAALLHDICKVDTIKFNNKTGYPSCPGHESKIYYLIFNDKEIQEFISNFGGDIINVAELCREHMRIKRFAEMRKSKQEKMKALKTYHKLLIFSKADNMLEPFEFTIADHLLFAFNKLYNKFRS